MYVFGVDIPLVEMIFVLLIVLVLFLIFMIILFIMLISLNHRVKKALKEESKELMGVKKLKNELDITRAEEAQELGILSDIKNELGALVRDEKKQNVLINKIGKLEHRIKKKHKDDEKKIIRQMELCPRCHIPMKRRGQIKAGPNKGLRTIYVCPKCGYSTMRDENLSPKRVMAISNLLRHKK